MSNPKLFWHITHMGMWVLYQDRVENSEPVHITTETAIEELPINIKMQRTWEVLLSHTLKCNGVDVFRAEAETALRSILINSHQPWTAQSSAPAVFLWSSYDLPEQTISTFLYLWHAVVFLVLLSSVKWLTYLLYILVQFSVYNHQWVVVSYSDSKNFYMVTFIYCKGAKSCLCNSKVLLRDTILLTLDMCVLFTLDVDHVHSFHHLLCKDWRPKRFLLKWETLRVLSFCLCFFMQISTDFSSISKMYVSKFIHPSPFVKRE